MPDIGVLRNSGEKQRKIVEIRYHSVLMSVTSFYKVIDSTVYLGQEFRTYAKYFLT